MFLFEKQTRQQTGSNTHSTSSTFTEDIIVSTLWKTKAPQIRAVHVSAAHWAMLISYHQSSPGIEILGSVITRVHDMFNLRADWNRSKPSLPTLCKWQGNNYNLKFELRKQPCHSQHRWFGRLRANRFTAPQTVTKSWTNWQQTGTFVTFLYLEEKQCWKMLREVSRVLMRSTTKHKEKNTRTPLIAVASQLPHFDFVSTPCLIDGTPNWISEHLQLPIAILIFFHRLYRPRHKFRWSQALGVCAIVFLAKFDDWHTEKSQIYVLRFAIRLQVNLWIMNNIIILNKTIY